MNDDPETTELEDFEYEFEVEDVKSMIAEALEGKATTMEEDASKESMLGAANITKVNYLRWAAGEFRGFASLVRRIPLSETRQRPAQERPTPEDLAASVAVSVPSVFIPPFSDQGTITVAGPEPEDGDPIMERELEEMQETVEVAYLENPPENGGSTVVGSKRRVRKSSGEPV